MGKNRDLEDLGGRDWSQMPTSHRKEKGILPNQYWVRAASRTHVVKCLRSNMDRDVWALSEGGLNTAVKAQQEGRCPRSYVAFFDKMEDGSHVLVAQAPALEVKRRVNGWTSNAPTTTDFGRYFLLDQDFNPHDPSAPARSGGVDWDEI